MREDVPKLMQAADICLMPSIFEGFGIVAIEAQAASLPILISDRFPDEIMISDYIRVVSLEESAEYWASNIVEFIQKKRTNNQKIIETFYPLEDGNSTRRIVETLAFDSSLRHTKDIIFLVNDLNQSGGVHTFVHNMAKYYKEKYNSSRRSDRDCNTSRE